MYDYKIWPVNYIDNALSATLTFVANAQLSHPAVFKVAVYGEGMTG